MTKRQILGVVLAVALVSVLIHRVDGPALARSLAGVHWAGLILAMALKVMSVFMKSRRWGIAIEGGSGQRVSKRLFSATLLGLGGNIVLPARMGELARLRLLARHNDVPAGFMASGAGVAYLLDAVLLSLCLVVLSAMSIGPQTTPRAAVAAAVVFWVAVTLVVVSERFRQVDWQLRLRSVLRLFPDKWTAQVSSQCRGFLRGFAALGHKQFLPRLLAYTTVILTLEIASLHIGLTAFGIGNSFVAATALVVVLQMSYAIPLTPGNIGTHQVICVLTLGAFGIGQEASLGFSLAFQSVAHITILSLAGLVLLLESFSATHPRPLPPRYPTSA